MLRFCLIAITAIACVEGSSSTADLADFERNNDTGLNDTGWRPDVKRAEARWAPRPHPVPVARPEPAAITPLHPESGGAPGTQRIAVPRHPSTAWDLGLCVRDVPAAGGVIDCGTVTVTVGPDTPSGTTVWAPGTGKLPEQLVCAPAAWLSSDPACPHWLDLH